MNIVTAVFNQYKFSSLPEFNAALKQFNVVADRGREEGRIFQNRGLVYRILDADGNKVGVPIKASSIGCKPILQNLEKKYLLNENTKEPFKQKIKNAIDDCIAKHSGSMKELKADLARKQIYAALRQNAEGNCTESLLLTIKARLFLMEVIWAKDIVLQVYKAGCLCRYKKIPLALKKKEQVVQTVIFNITSVFKITPVKVYKPTQKRKHVGHFFNTKRSVR